VKVFLGECNNHHGGAIVSTFSGLHLLVKPSDCLGLDDGDAMLHEAPVQRQVFFVSVFCLSRIYYVMALTHYFIHLDLFIQREEIIFREEFCNL
jgi:hypothetical protein